MKERPILFSAPMVRAILAGTKTQTRRVVKIPGVMPHTSFVITHPEEEIIRFDDGTFHYLSTAAMSGPYACPYGQPGDRLWVRETWRHTCDSLEEARALTEDITSGTAVDYRATYVDELMRNGPMARADAEECCRWETWKPSIHMPRWASRILLEVTDVRVQRLQDISGSDARAEGVERIHCYGPDCPDGEDGCNARGCYGARERFHELWDSINGAGAWGANPWVWALSFRRVAR